MHEVKFYLYLTGDEVLLVLVIMVVTIMIIVVVHVNVNVVQPIYSDGEVVKVC